MVNFDLNTMVIHISFMKVMVTFDMTNKNVGKCCNEIKFAIAFVRKLLNNPSEEKIFGNFNMTRPVILSFQGLGFLNVQQSRLTFTNGRGPHC